MLNAYNSMQAEQNLPNSTTSKRSCEIMQRTQCK